MKKEDNQPFGATDRLYPTEREEQEYRRLKEQFKIRDVGVRVPRPSKKGK